VDNEALLLMLKGACLRQMDKPLLAEEALMDAIALEEKIRDDTFIVPYSKSEVAFILMQRGEKRKATLLLEEIK
jgi:Flp pilus assembly protein TadD